MFWVFFGERERDCCSVDDRVPPHQALGSCFRLPVGKRPKSADGTQYLNVTVDDNMRMGCPCFLKLTFDALAGFTRCPGEVNAGGVPSNEECVRFWKDTEFVRADFIYIPDNCGICGEYIPVGSPNNKGVVERHIAM